MSGERQAGADSLSPRTVGITTGVATSGFLSLGLARGFDLDSSITTSFFIATKSVGDAFTTGFVFNNHVFFSFLDHLVYSATGSQAPWLLRLLPLLFAGVIAETLGARSTLAMLGALCGVTWLLVWHPRFQVGIFARRSEAQA